MTAIVASPPQMWQAQDALADDDRLQKFRSAIPQLSELVSEDKIKAHLSLMAAFTTLFRKVAGDVSVLDYRGSPALNLFLQRSVYRFLLWLDTIVGQPAERQSIQNYELPPLDVAALWHAFVLSPFEYFEDCLVKFPRLYSSGAYPLFQIVSYEFRSSTNGPTSNYCAGCVDRRGDEKLQAYTGASFVLGEADGRSLRPNRAWQGRRHA